MVKFMLVLSLIIQTIFVHAQNERHLKEFFKPSEFIGNSQKLKKYEPKMSSKVRITTINNFSQFIAKVDSNANSSRVEMNQIHLINLNNDDFIDVIYTNSLGLDCATFFYGLKDSFKLALNAPPPNFIKALKYQGKKCVEIVLESTPYIDAEHSEMVYNLVNDSFNLQSWRTNRECTSKPYKYYNNPIKIKTNIDTCPLREKPQITKGECFYENGDEFYNKNSNIIGRYKKGSVGLSWAKQRDKEGILWILVEMTMTDALPLDSGFVKGLVVNEHFIGWMQANHLEINH